MLNHFSKQVFLTSTEEEVLNVAIDFRCSVFSSEDKVVQEIDAEINVIYKILERRPQNGGAPHRKPTWYMFFHVSSDSGKFLKFQENRNSFAREVYSRVIEEISKILVEWAYITHGTFKVRYLVNGLLNALKFALRFPIGSFGRWMQSLSGFAFSKDIASVYRYVPCSMTPTRPRKEIVIVNFYLCLWALLHGAFLSFRPLFPSRYILFSFNYMVKVIIVTRLIVFLWKSLHVSWYLTMKCSLLP